MQPNRARGNGRGARQAGTERPAKARSMAATNRRKNGRGEASRTLARSRGGKQLVAAGEAQMHRVHCPVYHLSRLLISCSSSYFPSYWIRDQELTTATRRSCIEPTKPQKSALQYQSQHGVTFTRKQPEIRDNYTDVGGTKVGTQPECGVVGQLTHTARPVTLGGQVQRLCPGRLGGTEKTYTKVAPTGAGP